MARGPTPVSVDADGLDDALSSVEGDTHLRVWLTYGKLEARRYGDDFDVVMYGEGGGFIGRHEWSEAELRRSVSTALAAGCSAEVGEGLFKR